MTWGSFSKVYKNSMEWGVLVMLEISYAKIISYPLFGLVY